MSKQITDLLKILGFERHLTSGGEDYVYYKFHNKYMMDYYYDRVIKNKILRLSSSSGSSSYINIVIEDENEIIEMLFLRFKDKIDSIREFKLKSIGI